MAQSLYPEPSTGVPKGNTASRTGSPSLGDVYSNTQTGYLEVYTASGWSQLGVIPLSATIGVATNVANTAYLSGRADVAFTPNAGGGLATLYTATSTPGGFTGTGTSSPVRVTGLTPGTSYTFTVTATNGYGNALASSSSNSLTPTSVPQAPTITAASNGDASSVVQFTAGATGGSTITGYTVTSSPGGFTATGASSPLTVTGLTNGTAYTFTVTATNANGTSAASTASSSVTPVAVYSLAQTFNSSGNYTIPAGKTMLALVGTSAGGNGGGGGSNYRAGGGGGGSGAGFSVREIPVTAGTNYVVTLGGAGGATTFGNILTANGGNSGSKPYSGSGGTVSINAGTGDSLLAGGSGGGSYQSGQASAGSNSAAANSNDAQIASYTRGGGGAGGGTGGAWGAGGNGGNTRGTPFGGNGGGGGTSAYTTETSGGGGGAANGPGGGGGGGGGPGLGYNTGAASGRTTGPGGAAGAAQILVYVK